MHQVNDGDLKPSSTSTRGRELVDKARLKPILPRDIGSDRELSKQRIKKRVISGIKQYYSHMYGE